MLLGQLRLGGIAAVLRNPASPSSDRSHASDRLPLLSRLRRTHSSRRTTAGAQEKNEAQFRDPQKTLDNFDFNFNRKMNRSLVFDLATGAFIARHEDALLLGPPGTGKVISPETIGQSAIQQGYRVLLSRNPQTAR